MYIYTRLCGNTRSVLSRQTDNILYLLLYPFRVSGGDVYLVDDRNYCQTCIERQIGISQCLRFYTL